MLTIIAEQPPLTPNADGVIMVGKTRVPLDTIVWAFNDGATPEVIARQYPAVTLAEVYAVVGYYLNHKADVDAYVQAGEEIAEQVRAEVEARFPPEGIRERLLARRR